MSAQECSTKRCARCGEEKPRALAYFPKATGRFKDPLKSYCRTCDREYKRAWSKQNPEKVRLSKKAWQENNPEYWKEWRRRNVTHQRAKHIAYRAATKERDGAKHRAYRRVHRGAHRDEYNAKQRAKRAANPEQQRIYRKKYAAKNALTAKAWAEKNPQKILAYAQLESAERRAQKAGAPIVSFTTSDWKRCMEYWGFACAVCGRQGDLFGVTIAMDHWIPLSHPTTPGHCLTNVVPLCHGQKSCNNEKHNKLPTLWLRTKLGPRKAAKVLCAIASYFALITGG